MQRRTRNGIEVTHTEYLTDLFEWDYSSDPELFDEELRTFYINPGLKETFPWLSEMAGMYEKYTVKNLDIFYLTSSSTQERGKIIITPDYDVTDNPPTGQAAMLNTSGTKYGSFWEEIHCRIAPNKIHSLNKQLYVRDGSIPGEPKSYDGVKVFITCPGDGERLIGSLFIKYTIEFHSPQVKPPQVTTPFQRARYCEVGAQILPSGAANSFVEYGEQDYDTIGIEQTGPGVFILPAGTYRVKTRICLLCPTSGTSFNSNLSGKQTNAWGNNSIIGGLTSTIGNTLDQTWGGYFVSTGDNDQTSEFWMNIASNIVSGSIQFAQITFERLVVGALQSYLSSPSGLQRSVVHTRRLKDMKEPEHDEKHAPQSETEEVQESLSEQPVLVRSTPPPKTGQLRAVGRPTLH